jgi:flavin-dependent dehydrogenase
LTVEFELDMSGSTKYDVIIAGGGPAGASAAVHLAMSGARVLLAEQKKFPRAKLCGEFISPECALHFERLGVAVRMLAAQPTQIHKTVFYSRAGKSVDVPSAWFGANGVALGLSRAEMDERLLRRAGEAGVDVLEGAQVTSPLFDDRRVKGALIRQRGKDLAYSSRVTIDATGRTRSLARTLDANGSKPRASLVAFKAHLTNTQVAPDACEIYFYRGGYGGLSNVENGLSNLCFIASARDVRACGSDPERVVREIVCQNQRAFSTLAQAEACTPWLAVTLEKFGRHEPAPARGLLTIGDAASFIDPFTGSGMLMALESGELVARVLTEHLADDSDVSFDALNANYQQAYRERFDSRLQVCSLMRRAAFVPGFAGIAIRLFSLSHRFRRLVANKTRRADVTT